ncbi:SNARE associated Golgi protein [Macleaya cordata]|uniref:SNARE associated Golgi protein n=1 Tax=Macleaya cordata TaxID=56857 RepID=A0A200QH54_MACCD|nr:SNARE associated Golgi protein [Macleaya cordata]
MGNLGRLSTLAVFVAILGISRAVSKQYGWDKESALQLFRDLSDRLGFWAIPLYVLTHTVTLALCLPYAVFFEAGASLLFGFFPAVLCVFCAKVLGASLSFWIGRFVFRRSSSAMEWVQRNKYFHILSRGVEKDGWRFVLLARFSPMPSYVINYALAATRVGFLVDFLLPTVVGGLPMILQNTSIGSFAGAAVASASGSKKSPVLSYLLPLLGIVSSILISLRIKKYSSEITVADPSTSGNKDVVDDCNKTVDSSQDLYSSKTESEGLKKR